MRRNANRSLSYALALLVAGAAMSCASAQPSQDEHAAHGDHAEVGATNGPAEHTVVPPLTDADRAAAFPDLGGMTHAMLEDPFNASLHVDELETQQTDGADPFAWDVRAWFGHSLDRLALRTEGEIRDGDTERAELQALWAHGIARWWDIVAGARADFQPSPSRTWAAFGVQGIAPYRFDLEATVFLADGGDSAARVEAKYELLITQRWILEPLLELEWYGQDDPALGFASGLARSEGGLRLRYELRREVAPYIGVTHERRIGDSAELAQAAGEDEDDTRWVAGIRLRF
jgi:copper resistance protein B